MFKKLLTLLVMSSLGLCKAQDTTGYIETDAFTKSPVEYKHELATPKLIIENMPRIRTQGVLPICYGCSAATIVQKYICDNHPDYKGRKCSELLPENEVSIFDMISWSLTNKDGQSKNLPSNHKNIRIKDEDRIKAGGVMALLNSSLTPQYLAESCSTSAVLKRDVTADIAKEIELITFTLETYYSQLIANPKAKCETCYRDFVKAFDSSLDSVKFELAFQKKTFGEVLYQLLFSKDCGDRISMQNLNYRVGLYPLHEPSTRGDAIEVLLASMGSAEKHRPVHLDNVCIFIRPNGTDCLTHALVVSGYRYMCKKPNLKPSDSDCLLMLRIHNCWGEKWQRDNDDGWVVANQLIKNINRELPKLDDGALSWIK